MQEQFEIHIELKPGAEVKSQFNNKCKKSILAFLGKFNADYAELAKANPEMKNFNINIYPFGHELFSKDKGKIKRNFFV